MWPAQNFDDWRQSHEGAAALAVFVALSVPGYKHRNFIFFVVFLWHTGENAREKGLRTARDHEQCTPMCFQTLVQDGVSRAGTHRR
jgi:hypothetical protein